MMSSLWDYGEGAGYFRNQAQRYEVRHRIVSGQLDTCSLPIGSGAELGLWMEYTRLTPGGSGQADNGSALGFLKLTPSLCGWKIGEGERSYETGLAWAGR